MKRTKALLISLFLGLSLIGLYSCRQNEEKKIIDPNNEVEKVDENINKDETVDKDIKRLNTYNTNLTLKDTDNKYTEKLVYNLEVSNVLKEYKSQELSFNNRHYSSNEKFQKFSISDTNNINSDRKNGLLIRSEKEENEEVEGYAVFDFNLINAISKLEFSPTTYNQNPNDIKNLESFKILVFKNGTYSEFYDATNDVKNNTTSIINFTDENINKVKFVVKSTIHKTRIAIKSLKVYQKLFEYNILYDTNEGTFSKEKDTFFENTNFNIVEEPKKEGFVFLNWVDVKTKEVVDENTLIKGNMILKAFWTKKVKITFINDSENTVIEKNVGDTIQDDKDFIKPSKEGYTNNLTYKIILKDNTLLDIKFPLTLKENLNIKILFEIEKSKVVNDFRQLKDLYNQEKNNNNFNFEDIELKNVSIKKFSSFNFLVDQIGNLLLISQKDISLEENTLYNLTVNIDTLMHDEKQNDTVLVAKDLKNEQIVSHEQVNREKVELLTLADLGLIFNETKNLNLANYTLSIGIKDVRLKVVGDKIFLTDLEKESTFIELDKSSFNYNNYLLKDGKKYSKLYVYILGLNNEKDKLMVVLSREFGHSLIKE